MDLVRYVRRLSMCLRGPMRRDRTLFLEEIKNDITNNNNWNTKYR